MAKCFPGVLAKCAGVPNRSTRTDYGKTVDPEDSHSCRWAASRSRTAQMRWSSRRRAVFPSEPLLAAHAHQTTSCGRFKQFGYKHCGRCVPCLVRRAAFLAWRGDDSTYYVYDNLALDDDEHAGFDDVRSALIGIGERREMGTARWLGATLSSNLVTDKPALLGVVERGLAEIESLMLALGVR